MMHRLTRRLAPFAFFARGHAAFVPRDESRNESGKWSFGKLSRFFFSFFLFFYELCVLLQDERERICES